MATAIIGRNVYDERYVVEQDGDLFGPFDSRSDACDFATQELDLSFTIRALNVPMRHGV